MGKYESEDKLGADSRADKYKYSKGTYKAVTETTVPGDDAAKGPGAGGDKKGY